MENTEFDTQNNIEIGDNDIDNGQEVKGMEMNNDNMDNNSTGSFEVINESEYDFEMKKTMQMY